jgi:hypothetical protein
MEGGNGREWQEGQMKETWKMPGIKNVKWEKCEWCRHEKKKKKLPRKNLRHVSKHHDHTMEYPEIISFISRSNPKNAKMVTRNSHDRFTANPTANQNSNNS